MSNQSMYAMYVIGTVESNCNWAAINTNDPITLGMMQWYGNRAKSLILRGKSSDASGYNQYFAATTAAKQAEADADMSYYYTTQADEQAWYKWAGTDPNHTFQQAQWEDDYTAYAKVCDQYGFPANNMRERIFFMCMYHQSPVSAFRVLGNTSATANLDLLHSTSLNDSVLGQYPDRYNTAYKLLKDWDGTSAPPDFGQTGDDPGSGGNGGNVIPPTPATKKYVQLVGDTLVLHDGDKKYQFHRNAQQMWTNSGVAGQPNNGGQTGGGSDTGPDAGKNVVAWVQARLNKFAYSQAGGRLDPDTSGYTDCSGLWWRAYQDITGIDVGTYTGAMAGKGKRIAVSGSDSPSAAIAKTQPADLLLLTWSGHNPAYDHVQGFTGSGVDDTLSHGGPGNGPVHRKASDSMAAASEWEIRRYL